ncbi:hypothetical protein [Pseudidiomarina sp.]|uniref:hypothetical protein n=1 Tax=Pseudidiomarina sp. TaxID=2081707 RepID=UPI003A981337
MKLLLILCANVALLTAVWTANIFVWFFVVLGIICALSLGVIQHHRELSSLIGSAFFIAAGFTSLHAGITTMATDTLQPQVTTFAAPVALVLLSCLLFCIAMVERSAVNAAELPSKLSARRSS